MPGSIWTGRRAGVDGAVKGWGAEAAFPLDELEKTLARFLENAPHVYHALLREDPLAMRLLALIRRAQEAGGVAADRDPDAEAWIGMGLGLLRSVQARLGGVLTAPDFLAITRSRRLSLTPPSA